MSIICCAASKLGGGRLPGVGSAASPRCTAVVCSNENTNAAKFRAGACSLIASRIPYRCPPPALASTISSASWPPCAGPTAVRGTRADAGQPAAVPAGGNLRGARSARRRRPGRSAGRAWRSAVRDRVPVAHRRGAGRLHDRRCDRRGRDKAGPSPSARLRRRGQALAARGSPRAVGGAEGRRTRRGAARTRRRRRC